MRDEELETLQIILLADEQSRSHVGVHVKIVN